MSGSEVLKRPEASRTDKDAGNQRILELLSTVGERVRHARGTIGLSRRELSERSGVSQRYLAQLETGQGNISLALLMRIAEALDARIGELIVEPGDRTSSARHAELARQFERATEAQRARVMQILQAVEPQSGTASGIALIGLRGAGKSTLGELAAHKLGIRFVELNNEIEIASGIAIDEVIELYGHDGYRHLEFQALERLTETQDQIIVAVAGGIVSQPGTFNYLLDHYHTIWLKASPEEHMGRVRMQGDERPMAGNPNAMKELRRILMSREPHYARATVQLDTSGAGLDDTLDRLLDLIETKAFLTS